MTPPKMREEPDEPQPKYFAVDTPVLSKEGELQKEANGSLKKVKEHGVLTCFHIAHQPGWKAYIQANRVALMARGTGKRQRRHSM